MPLYQLKCEACGFVGEEFHHLSAWKELKEGETPFSKKCPECKSKEYYRIFDQQVFAETSPEQRGERLKRQIVEDNKKLAKGDMDFIRNIAGDKPINGKSGVKYMKDVKKAAVRRRL